MSRQIQTPNVGVDLANAYAIKGGLQLRLDETIVPVHLVNPDQGGGGGAGSAALPAGGIPIGSRGASGFQAVSAGGVGNWRFAVLRAEPRGAFPFIIEWIEFYGAAAATDTFFGGIGIDPDFGGGAEVAGNRLGFTEPTGLVFGSPLQWRTRVSAGAVAAGPVIFETAKINGQRHYLNWRIGQTPTGALLTEESGTDTAFFANGTLNEAWRICAKIWVPPVT